MTKHPNAQVLEKLYSDFGRGDIPAVLAACADNMSFNVPGKSKLAGKYTKATFASDYLTKLMELSGGTIKLDVHDIMGSDQHGVVLLTDKLTRAGKAIEYRTVHVWRFENGKPVAWYEYPRDLYAFDGVWT